jgi:hypothetical protein
MMSQPPDDGVQASPGAANDHPDHNKKPGGRPPAPPLEGPHPRDQINPTDEDSRIMPVAGGV